MATAPLFEVPARLTALFAPDAVRAHLPRPGTWHPYPTRDERAEWGAVPDTEWAPLIVDAEQHLGAAWPALPATRFMDFQRDGDRSRFETPYFARRGMLMDLTLGECAEGGRRFLDDIINGVWAICEESSWCVPAHAFRYTDTPVALPDVDDPVVDLFAADTAATLAWVHYLLRDTFPPEVAIVLRRIAREVRRRVLIPYRTNDDWWWLGKRRERPVNNWTPWILSNILASTLLLETDPAIQQESVLRAIEGLDVFLATYHADGGCDEGIMYWGRAAASLFDCLDLLANASGGALDGFSLPLVREMGRYLYRMHIGGPWYVNFADGTARAAPESDLVYRYGRRIGDPALMAQGAYSRRFLPPHEARRTDMQRRLAAIFNVAELGAADATPPLIREAWLPGVQVLTARERAGSADGLFLAAKGGHNAESHNHNDVGSFIVALDGVPVVIDVGVETYRRQTFNEERYTIWTMQSGYHNLPMIDGHAQLPGQVYAARDVAAEITDDYAELSLDIAGAYGATEDARVDRWSLDNADGAKSDVGIVEWRRALRLERGARPRVVIEDAYRLDHEPATLASHLMLAGPVDTSAPGVLRCITTTRPLLIRYDAETFTPTVQEIPITDARLLPVWGDRIFRVVLSARQPAAQGTWRLVMEAGNG
jgi:hypothetical protein